jgi:UDPglucose 6-dehydrogenase
VHLAEGAYDAADGAHALAIVTEWNEFRDMHLGRLKRLMKKPVLCDLRNLYDPDEVEAAGLVHVGVGKGRPAAPGRRKRA